MASGDTRLHPGQEPPLGSHLVTRRTLYSHHGIYVGGGRVVHYAGFAQGFRRGPVEEVSLRHFAHGHGIRLRHDRRCFDGCDVVARARSRLGECHYDILRNNCEHFCAWALRDETRSRQVDWLGSVARVLCRWIKGVHLIATTARGQWDVPRGSAWVPGSGKRRSQVSAAAESVRWPGYLTADCHRSR
jgi:hypothetical protein